MIRSERHIKRSSLRISAARAGAGSAASLTLQAQLPPERRRKMPVKPQAMAGRHLSLDEANDAAYEQYGPLPAAGRLRVHA